MKVRSLFFGAAAMAAVALVPNSASAQVNQIPPAICNGATYDGSHLGIGGFLTGCFQFTLTELGENAGGVGDQFFWNNAAALLGTGTPNNASSLGAGTHFFNDDCNSTGSTNGPSTTFAFCDGTNGTTVKTTGLLTNIAGELVIGMNAQDLVNPPQNGGANYWIYSGAQVRNTYPNPPGFQEVLYQLTTAGVFNGDYLFAWEDINDACTSVAGSTLHPNLTTFASEDLGNKVILDDPNNCNNPVTSPTPSDQDFNDSYIVLHIIGGRQDTVTPEPMTMTLMATGLVGLGGASLRRRRNKK